MYSRFRLAHLPLALLAVSSPSLEAEEAAEEGARDGGAYQEGEGSVLALDDVLVTAERELKQAPGVSIITADDIKKRPPVNDLSDIIRKMPGVNLTGNSASGQYGNNRQIDIRGMGPENTLILIDGKPVRSRNSVRMGRSGERNTRGDTNWVPAELVERIEVLRGPAAARYGSGAAGGVVNIITKAPTEKTHGSLSWYANSPESEYEGQTRRYSFSLTGPVVEGLSYRLSGNLNKTDADDPGLNSAYATETTITPPAGKEGVRNRDLNGLLRWDLNSQQTIEVEGSYSRQGNIYAGDRAVSSTGSELLNELIGRETNIMYRRAGSITHRGNWDWGSSQLVFSYENTRNRRLNEGLAGGSEGSINVGDMSTSEYDNYALSGEVSIPFTFGFSQVATLGFEYTKEVLDDPYSVTQSTTNGGVLPGTGSGPRDSEATNENIAFFAESNIHLTERWTLTPEPEHLLPADRCRHRQGRSGAGLQGAQPVPVQHQLYLLHHGQRLPGRLAEPGRRLLRAGQRQPGCGKELELRAGRRLRAGRLERRGDLFPQRIRRQDRGRPEPHRPHRGDRRHRADPHVGERAQGGGGRPGRHPERPADGLRG